MDEKLKQRMVGAAVLVSMAVIFLPMVLETASDTHESITESNVPPQPKGAFQSRIVPATEAELQDPQRSALPPAAAPSTEQPPAETRVPAQKQTARKQPVKQVTGGLTAWVVQLGSFSETGNAVGLLNRLRAKGYAAFVETVKLDGGRSTRVYIGPELLRARALKAQKQLEREFGMKGLVVRYPAS